MWSTVVTTFAKLPGWRKVTGLTSVPSLIVVVSRARPARTAHAVRRRPVAVAREARVVVAPEERLEAGRFGVQRQGELLLVGHPLLGLGHQREAHRILRLV